MFCTKCGKELPENGICTCSAQPPVQQEPVQQVQSVQQTQAVQQTQPVQQSAQTEQTGSKLPDGQAIAEGAKKAANAIKNSPIFSEIFGTLKGVIISPVKQVSANAARKDILWVFLAIIEVLLIPFSLTTLLRRGFFSLIKEMGLELKYGDYSKMLKEVGASAFKIYFLNLISAVICIIIMIATVKLLMVILRKKAPFFAVANMVTTALLPFTMMMTLGGIVGLFYAPYGLVLALWAVVTFVVLGYVGIQKLDKFTVSPFWPYVIYMGLITLIVVAFGAGVVKAIASGVVENLSSSLFGGFGSFF